MIHLREVTLRRGAKVVLERTNLTVHAGEKVGLVGRNGAGKSSLFALLAGRLHADKGDVEVPPRWRVGEVAQSMPETDDGATEFVLQGDDVLMRAQAQLIEAEPDIYFRPAYYGPSDWIGIALDRPRVDWDHVADRIATSWELAAPRRLLEAGGR